MNDFLYWKIAPKYGLIGCLVQKSLSTLLDAVMCLLFDEEKFMKNGREFRKEFSKIGKRIEKLESN
jgi:hypothetical protein